MRRKRNLNVWRAPILLSAAAVAMLAGSTSAKTTKAKPAPPTSDIIKTKDGVLRITPKFHGSFQITFGGKVFEIDPVSAASYTRKADYILITHAHPDHFDLAAIKKLVRKNESVEALNAGTLNTTDRRMNTTSSTTGPSTTVIAPESVIKQLQSMVKSALVSPPVTNGMKITEEEATPNSSGEYITRRIFTIEAVAMYNVVREREKGEKYHPKGVGNGYILTLGGKRIYIAGDTEATPEMQKLKNIDIAFLPMNLPYTMTPKEAAKAARAFKPKIVYPYHYRSPFNKVNTNAHQFAAELKGTGIQVRVREWYPKAAVARATAAAKK